MIRMFRSEPEHVEKPVVESVPRREFLKGIVAGVSTAAATGVLDVDGYGQTAVSAKSSRAKSSSRSSASRRIYTNPVYKGSMPDPFVIRQADVYCSDQ